MNRRVVGVVGCLALFAGGLAAACTAAPAQDAPAPAPTTISATASAVVPASPLPSVTGSAPNLPGATASNSPAGSAAASQTAGSSSSDPVVLPTAKPPDGRMTLAKKILGHLDEKSVVASSSGLFFAQNMMYLHTINVYDRHYQLLKIIPDAVKLSDFGYPQYPGTYKGAPVEAAFTPDGKSAYVSNYSMYGAAPFDREGSDTCKLSDHYPNSFVYRINTSTLSIDQVIEVGSVPKYVAVTPNGKYVLVSNWCSYSESVIDTATGKALMQIPLGAYPRGIAVDPTSSTAYVAVMGSTKIAVIDLSSFAVSWITGVGSAPRHLVISPDGRWLYATINGDGVVDKIDLTTRKVVARVATGRAPRSMTISPEGSYIYVVNYMSNTMSKVRTSDMRVVQTVDTLNDPIGITYDDATNRIWVACYSGAIMVFNDGTPA
ncbi:MAG: cytochrome D1 domain-containing protein [Acidothermaceae bacterium]